MEPDPDNGQGQRWRQTRVVCYAADITNLLDIQNEKVAVVAQNIWDLGDRTKLRNNWVYQWCH